MKILLVVLMSVLFVSCGCLEDLKKDKEDKAVCTVDCRSTIEGQIFYSAQDIFRNQDYILGAFKIYLLGSGHAYAVDPDEDGNYSQVAESGKYMLVAEYHPEGNKYSQYLGDYYDADYNLTWDNGLIGGFRDINNGNLYQLAAVKSDIDVLDSSSSVYSLDLINPKRLYIAHKTGEIIVITNNTDDVATSAYANSKIKDYCNETGNCNE